MPTTRSTILPVCTLLVIIVCEAPGQAAAEQPCDRYPVAKQVRCAAIWKELNHEDANTVGQFGLAQQKRRDEGKINAEQHLAENMAYIKQSTEKRLERLRERMAKE